MTTNINQQQSSHPLFNFFDAQQFRQMQKISRMYAISELVPEIFKAGGKTSFEKATANCMIAISLALRMQADPLIIMQQLLFVDGHPCWSTKFLISILNGSERFEPLKYRFKSLGPVGKIQLTDYIINPQTGEKEIKDLVFDGSEIDNLQCTAYTREKDFAEELESSGISIRTAIEEGWYTRAGSKWKTMPQKMLMYRAASFWMNEYAPEISMGLKTREEILDIAPIENENKPVNPPVKSKTQPDSDIEKTPGIPLKTNLTSVQPTTAPF